MHERYFVRGGRAHLGTGQTLEDAAIEVVGTKIGRVGRSADFGEADLEGNTLLRAPCVSPGLVDAHTHLGVWRQGAGRIGHDLNEASELVAPHLRAADSIDPRDTAFGAARAAGITSVAVSPGSSSLVGGQIAFLKTAGTRAAEMTINPSIGMKVAFGAVPLSRYDGRGPSTRMGAAGALREALVAATNYALLRKDRGEACPRSLRHEALCRVLQQDIPLHVHCHEAHSILTILQIAKEFGCRVVLVHGTDAPAVADALAEAKVPVIFGPALMTAESPEVATLAFSSAEVLRRSGVVVALTTDHGAVPINQLLTLAALTVKSGMPEEAAFDAVTSVPASICGMGDRIGRIASGYDADIVLYDGDPLDVRTHVVRTIVNARLVDQGPERAS